MQSGWEGDGFSMVICQSGWDRYPKLSAAGGKEGLYRMSYPGYNAFRVSQCFVSHTRDSHFPSISGRDRPPLLLWSPIRNVFPVGSANQQLQIPNIGGSDRRRNRMKGWSQAIRSYQSFVRKRQRKNDHTNHYCQSYCSIISIELERVEAFWFSECFYNLVVYLVRMDTGIAQICLRTLHGLASLKALAWSARKQSRGFLFLRRPYCKTDWAAGIKGPRLYAAAEAGGCMINGSTHIESMISR